MTPGKLSPQADRALPSKNDKTARQKALCDELDEALAATFPASEPPALVTKGTVSSPRHDGKKAHE
jgi:hypothetical protein